MNKLIKILHIDPNWKIMYILNYGRSTIKTKVSIETALSLLSKQKFDLILTEPLNTAILTPQESIEKKIIRGIKWLARKSSEGPLEPQTAED
ncbi:MAG: hypothetical protein HY787_11075 [Deltaproteobacteria bacterium]|jgi:hypothetical protein|nr:hypothetical protein [Deltaproteobacteria bacterium]